MEKPLLKMNGGLKIGRATSKSIDFEYFAPAAQSVKVGGTFNQWNPSENPLKKAKDGKWKASIKLAPGRYEYRYQVDGSWANDQRPVECVPNSFGSWNCVIEVQ